MTDAGSEFQTDCAAHRKERFAKSVRANGWMSSGVADERSVRALTRRFMRWLRYCGTDVFRVLYVNTNTRFLNSTVPDPALTSASVYCVELFLDVADTQLFLSRC